MVPHVYAGSLKWETVKITYSENIKHTIYPIKYLSDLLVIFRTKSMITRHSNFMEKTSAIGSTTFYFLKKLILRGVAGSQ